MIYLPKPIAWGKDNGANAWSKYVEHMRSIGHVGLTNADLGFVVHPEKHWLRAAPNAWVTDPLVQQSC